jgi:hypothetical protein
MVTNFYRNKEGEAEYRKIGISYENSIGDDAYNHFLKITSHTPKEKRKREILSLTRKVIGDKQFILWNQREIAYDGIGNEKHFFKDCGRFPKPIPTYELRQIPGTLQAESYVSGIREIHTGYVMEFNLKNADSFVKDFVGSTDDDLDKKPTHFYFEVGNSKFSVDSFQEWRDMPLEAVQKYGKLPLLQAQQQQQKQH